MDSALDGLNISLHLTQPRYTHVSQKMKVTQHIVVPRKVHSILEVFFMIEPPKNEEDVPY